MYNSPREELASFERILFQLELAFWYYEDHFRERDPSLPKFQLRDFVKNGPTPHPSSDP